MSTLKKKSAIALAWDFGGMLIQNGSGFAITIVLARVLSPAEFGLIGMAMVFIAFSQVFIDVGFSSALIQNENNSDEVYNSVFYFNIFAGLILTLLFFFIAPLIGGFYENEQITTLVRWLSLSFLFNSFNQVQAVILKKELNFKVLTIRNVLAAIIGGVVGVVAALSGFGVYSLVLQVLITALVSTVLLWSFSKWKPRFYFSYSELKKLVGYSSYVFFDSLISTAFGKLDVLLIGKVFSPATLGFYSRAVSLKDQVSLYSSSSIAKIFFPVLSSLQGNKVEYERVYYKVLSVGAFIAFGLTGILYILGEEIILGLFGEKWQVSVPIFQILILSVCNAPINRMMVNAFMSRGKSKENFYIGIFRKAIQIVPLIIAYYYGIIPFSIAIVISYYFITICNMYFLKYYLGLSVKKHIKKIFEGAIPLILAIASFHFIDGTIERILLAIGFVIVYCLFHFMLKTEGSIFLLDNLKKIKSKVL